MRSRLLPAAVLLAAGLSARAQPPKAAPPPAKPVAPAAPAAPDETRLTISGPVTVGSLPPVDPLAPPPLFPPSPVVLTKYGLTLLVMAGTDSEKTALVAQIPLGVAADFQRKYVAANGWMDLRSPVFSLTGRLTTEDEPGLFPTGVAPILTDVPVFELGEKRRLVLVVVAVGEQTRFTKDKYPPEGTVAVEGRPADAKADLKLTETSALAVRNGRVPVVVPNRTPQAAALVRATGSLRTADGRAEVTDAIVRVVKK